MISRCSQLDPRDHIYVVCERRGAIARAGHRAFTLIELIAVLALMALLASLAAVSVRRSDSIARVAADVAQFDRLARAHARQTGMPVQVKIDLRRRAFSRRGAMTLEVPEGYLVRSIRSAGELATLGTARVDYSMRGQSQTYAVLLSGPRDERLWVLFPGLTSSSLTMEADREIDQVFSTLSTRDDAR